MALDKAGLAANLLSAFNQAKASPMTESAFANLIATAIDTYVKTASVNSGIAVQVVPATGTGATTAPGTLS